MPEADRFWCGHCDGWVDAPCEDDDCTAFEVEGEPLAEEEA